MQSDRAAVARARLEARLALAVERVGALAAQHHGIIAASYDSNSDDEHDPEGSTIAWEREQVGALLVQSRATVRELERALARVDAGTYGVCEGCGGEIPEGRLEARPDAGFCINCAQDPRRSGSRNSAIPRSGTGPV